MAKTALTVELNDKKEYQRLLDGIEQTHGLKVGRVYLEPGQDCHEHSTEAKEELLVFLAGQGQLDIKGQNPLSVGQGKIAYVPPHTLHNVKNTSSDPLVYIFCVTAVDA